MTKLELLAPAKNLECGIAAIDHGADAVYIGARSFGARAAVGNSTDDIRRLCDYARPYGVRVYVTVNTLLFDHELETTRQLISELSDAGVDAILVQDMAILSLLNGDARSLSPKTQENRPLCALRSRPLSIHASTQTDNRTADKVRWLRDLGFSRVVLARELSSSEIAEIHRQVPDVELEVFVHGALCVSYSGKCYASQHLFGRSANRGQCAQVCRMKFDLLDSDGRELIHQRHLLSLKDLNQSDHLEELIEAGATSFKIEGRLKDVSYVKNVVTAYSQRLDAIIRRHPNAYQRASLGHCRYTFVPALEKTFNRGFTTYFLHGRQQGIFSPDTPKAMGEYVGSVKELRPGSFNVAGTARFANGDGLCFINAQRELEGFRVNRAEGNRLYPQQMPANLRPGMALYRNNDMEFERVLSGKTAERKIPVVFRLEPIADGFSLKATVSSSFTSSVAISCEHQQAVKPQHDNIVRQLSKLGGTPYECSGVELPEGFSFFIPNSVLSSLRQQWLESLNEKRCDNGGVHSCDSGSHSDDAPQIPDNNISNHLAADFYHCDGTTAYELRPDHRPLMQCRHCLRFELGCCVKHGGSKPTWREPLFLRLADGHRFRLEFDCKNCQMNVYEASNQESKERIN